MGERKGTNKYYPPDFDPRLHRSLDAYHGTHALRERAKKIGQGIIVIRFEMPYNIWCGGCGRHVAMGVRYNAEKKKVGMYFSTPIYEFNMKCHLCDQRYLIRTDPANFDYVIVSGARRKEQRWDPTENGQIAPEDGETKRRLATDAMYRLEHGKDDEVRGSDAAPRLAALAVDTGARGANDIQLNRLVRAGLREERKRLAAETASDADLMARHSLTGGSLALLPESADDEVGAQLLRMDGVAPVDAVRPSKRKSEGLDSSDDRSGFKLARLGELDSRRRRSDQSRLLVGVVRRSTSATSSTMAGTSATSPTMVGTSATSPTMVGTSVTSPTMAGTSATSSTVAGTSATSSTMASTSATSSTMAGTSATSSTVAGTSATSSTMAGTSATSSTVAGTSATSSTMAGTSSTSPTVAGTSATSSTDDGTSATSPTVADTLATSPMMAGTSATSSTVAGTSATSPLVAGTSATSTTLAGTSATSPTVAGTSATSSMAEVTNASTVIVNPSEDHVTHNADCGILALSDGLVQYSSTPSPSSSTTSDV